MATFSSVTSQHVLAAIAEHDERGAEGFLATHGYVASPDAQILHEGQRYDARAIMAVAHRFATGRLATPDEFRSSLEQALIVLRRRGFELAGPVAATVRPPAARRAPAAKTPRTPAPAGPRKPHLVQRVATVCPTCSTELPATGICDDCG